MSDLHGPSDDAASPDREHPDIRALLAGLGAHEPLPGDVAARLDETLAGLVVERHGSGDRDTDGRVVVPAVLPLDRPAARRRRWAPRLLAAATVAAIVGGIGIGIAQLPGGSGGSGGANSAGSAAESGGGNADKTTSAQGPAAAVAVPRLSTKHFRADARRLLAAESTLGRFDSNKAEVRQPKPKPSTEAGGTGSSPHDLADLLAACGKRPGLPTGARAVPVRLDGQPATVVLRPRSHGVVQVTAYVCSGERVLATTTVPR